MELEFVLLEDIPITVLPGDSGPLRTNFVIYESPWTLCISDYGNSFYHSDLKISLENKHVQMICEKFNIQEETFYQLLNNDMFDAKRIQEIVDSINKHESTNDMVGSNEKRMTPDSVTAEPANGGRG